MTVFSIFVLAGIALFIAKHRIWGTFCFLIAAIALLAMM
jgi:hypothetical protein